MAIYALVLGGIAFVPLLFGAWVTLTTPADRMTGGDWGFLGLYALCAAVGAVLIAGGLWVLRREMRR
jgi:hypothetical protein